MFQPKRTKYRKYQKGRVGGIKPNQTCLQFGQYGIKSLEAARIRANTLEAVSRAMTRKFKRAGQIWIRTFPDVPVTAKPLEVRMGKGKGSTAYWACRVQPGQILYEIEGVPFKLAKQAALLASHKLPIRCGFFIEN